MDTADLTLKLLVEIRDRILVLETDITQVKSDVAGVKVELTRLRTDMTDQLHRVDIRLSETQIDVNRIQARLTRMDIVHRTRMDELELAYLEVREMDARVARAEADLAALKASRPQP